MLPHQQPTPTPNRTLVTLRIIWAALLFGQFMFLTVVLGLLRSPTAAPRTGGPPLPVVGLGMLVVMVPAAFIARRAVFGSVRPVPPGKYATGTIIFLAILEGASMFGLVLVMITREWWPSLLLPAVAGAVQALSFPSGGPMEDAGGRTRG